MCRPKWFFYILSVIGAAGIVSCASSPPVEPSLPPEEPVPVVAEDEGSARDTLLAAILDHLRAGDFDGALALFDDFSDEDAGTTEIRLLKTSVFVSAGHIAEARTLAGEVIEDEPQSAEALYTLSMVEAAAGNERARRNALDGALKIDENHIPSLNALGNIYLRNDVWRLAAVQFDKVLSKDPDNLAALIGKASTLRYQKQPAEAMGMAAKAVELYPDRPEAYIVRSRVFRDLGNTDRALDDLLIAEKLAPDNYWTVYDKGRALLSLRRTEEALLAFERAISLDKTEFAAYIYSAGILADKGEFAAAEARYVELAGLNPDYFYALEGIGMLKMKNKEYAAARDAFLSAYAKAPEESSYAVLAALNALRVQKPFEVKPFLETAMRVVKRNSLEYAMLRVLNDFNGEVSVARQIDAEKNTLIKGRMAFYLAEFYDICNKPALANAYYEKCREANRRDTVEWRLNQWKMEERNLLVQAASQNDPTAQ